MPSYSFYEPFYLDIERVLNDSAFSKHADGVPACPAVRSFKPRVDLHEDSEKNLTTATFEFPGVSKDDVQLNLQNGKLTVSAETKKSEEHAEAGYVLRERLYGKFSRTIQLPQGVQEEQIKATLANGILTVTFPRSLPEVAPKKITISDA